MNFDKLKKLVLIGRSNSIAPGHMEKRSIEMGDGTCVSIVTEPVDNSNTISFFKRRLRDDNASVSFGYK